LKYRTGARRGESRDESANRFPQDHASGGLLGDSVLPAVFVKLALIVFAAGDTVRVIPYE